MLDYSATNIAHINRSYHDSDLTPKILSNIPPWMKMRDKNSIGYHYVNALVSQEVDTAVMLLNSIEDSLGIDGPDLSEQELAYYNTLNTTEKTPDRNTIITATLPNNIHLIPSGTLSNIGNTITPIIVDKLESFANGAPTRLTYNQSDDIVVSGLTGDLTGIGYTKNWSVRDEDGLYTIEEQDVIIVNQMLASPISDVVKSTIVLDTNGNHITSYDYGLSYQDYAHTGNYEVITDPSGTTLTYNPIISSVKVYDYINTDASGNAQPIASGYYSITSTVTDHKLSSVIVMSGVNPYNGYSIDNSNYFVEYQYCTSNYPKMLTTQKGIHGIQRMASPPVFTSAPTGYFETIVTPQGSETIYDTGKLLRFNPIDVRPGAAVSVKYNYVGLTSIACSGLPFIYDMSSETNFIGLDDLAIHCMYDNSEVTLDYDITLTGNTITLDVVDEEDRVYSNSSIDTVVVYYSAQKDYGTQTTVQSFNDYNLSSDPYAADYTIVGGNLHPYTMLPITDTDDYILNTLYNAGIDDFDITTSLLFSGIAYDQDKDCYWVLESNNMILYKVRPGDNSIIGKYPIFKRPNIYTPMYKTLASGFVDEFNNVKMTYPFYSYSIDDPSRSASGIVYYKDFLYILSYSSGVVANNNTIGGDGIYRLDTYDNRVMDIKYNASGHELYPHFPLYNVGIPGPSSVCSGHTPADITVNSNGDFLLAGGNTISKLVPMYDYIIIDASVNEHVGTIYYREPYSGVNITGFNEVY
jgi:hypothetical protein